MEMGVVCNPLSLRIVPSFAFSKFDSFVSREYEHDVRGKGNRGEGRECEEVQKLLNAPTQDN